MFITENPDYLPDIISRITETQMAEDVNVSCSAKPNWMDGFQLAAAAIMGIVNWSLTSNAK